MVLLVTTSLCKARANYIFISGNKYLLDDDADRFLCRSFLLSCQDYLLSYLLKTGNTLFFFSMSYVILIGIGVTGLIFYIHRKRRHSFFRKLGIPGPKPHWLFGNLHQIWGRQLHVVYRDWSEEFGEFYGYFEGPTPILVTSSLDGVEQICVKQYSNFQGHRFGVPVRPDPTILSQKQQTGPTSPNLFFEWGKVWKKQRLLCNPAFSTGKMKQYKQFVTATQNKLMDKFTEKCEAGEDFEIQPHYQCFTIVSNEFYSFS